MPHGGLEVAELHDEVSPEVGVCGPSEDGPDYLSEELECPSFFLAACG